MSCYIIAKIDVNLKLPEAAGLKFKVGLTTANDGDLKLKHMNIDDSNSHKDPS